jgi:hypothetical protein
MSALKTMDPEHPYMLMLSGWYGLRIHVYGDRLGRWGIALDCCPGSDEMWESLTFATVFSTEEAAQTRLAEMKTQGQIDLRYWRWYPSRCSPLSFMHMQPCALLDVSTQPYSE